MSRTYLLINLPTGQRGSTTTESSKNILDVEKFTSSISRQFYTLLGNHRLSIICHNYEHRLITARTELEFLHLFGPSLNG